MKIILSLLIVLCASSAISQNSFMYLKNGEKITVKDTSFYKVEYQGFIKYKELNAKGKFSSKKIDMKKIDRIETSHGVTYSPYYKDKKVKGFFKTMIDGTKKDLIYSFGKGDEMGFSMIVDYYIIDANKNEITSGKFGHGNVADYKKMVASIKYHFPDCAEVLENIAKFSNPDPDFSFATNKLPDAFVFQNRVFACD